LGISSSSKDTTDDSSDWEIMDIEAYWIISEVYQGVEAEVYYVPMIASHLQSALLCV
jgi:hypothetical protein